MPEKPANAFEPKERTPIRLLDFNSTWFLDVSLDRLPARTSHTTLDFAQDPPACRIFHRQTLRRFPSSLQAALERPSSSLLHQPRDHEWRFFDSRFSLSTQNTQPLSRRFQQYQRHHHNQQASHHCIQTIV